jgi:putative FmdB family regulatory protein
MPIYDYKCNKCDYVLTDCLQPMEEKEGVDVRCPLCKSEMHRMIGAPSQILFKSKGGYTSTVAEK